MTESKMDNHALPVQDGASAASGKAAAAGASSKLNPTAATFVFRPTAPVWTPPSTVAPPTSPALVPAPAPPSAPTTPVKSSVLKPSAKEFVPSFLAKPFVPASFAAPVPPPAVEEVAKATDDEPAQTDSSSSTSTHVEPESEDLNEAEDAKTDDVEAETAEEVVPVEEEEEEATEQDAVIAERIIYTIAQLIEMEPESTPMPASVVGTQVAAVKSGKDEDAPPASKGGRGGSRRGESSRGLNRSNSNFGEGRGRGRGRGGRGGRNAAPEPPLEDVEPLQINEETRWKPSHSKARAADDAAEDTNTTEVALKEAKSILNKLSIEKFDKLSNQLIEVAVRHVDVLSGVIEMVISKAQQEWHFSTMYAELCSKIAQTEMPAIALDENEVAQDTHKLFRKLLLSRCQKEFEVTPSKEGLDDLPEDERLEKELILKRATLGHIRFVGELYIQRMLSARIMHECIQRLFGDLTKPDEESLECLCKLLTTIGQKLETSAKDQGEVDLVLKYYTVIKQLAGDSERLCTRVRFMLQDLLDLRKNKWVARRKETKAMTIAEVHAEAAREAKEKAKASASNGGGSSRGLNRSQSMSGPMSEKRRSSKEGGSASAAWKARAASTSSVDPDGWETVNPVRPKLVKSRSTAERAPRHPSLTRNSSDGTNARNSFASLSGNGGRKERERSFSSSAATPSSSQRRTNSSSSLKDLDARPPRPQSDKPSKRSSEDAPKSESLTADVFEKKIKGIFEEYVELRDLEEAVTCVSELNSSEHHALIVTQTMNVGLEKGKKEREAVATLLAGLHERQVLDSEAFATSLHELLEFAEDLEIDIPLTLTYIAEMIAPSVAAGGVSVSRLVESIQHMTYNGKAAKLIALTLAAIDDEDKTKEVVASVDVKALLAEDQRETEDALQTLYEEYQLTYLL
ncbi:hypothetical protein Poli38472_014620 [Pythium oligandrum]|uniref:MI domain-containing protein n=1 Tax=Pythium oligandrum TaxID=41045 RepID=A0A8K1FHI0_PYTOL|nr:hypothetical protein Poli38472_014620 [Pythium oligandrum]|eukprot:TMW63915.1 hypothetical protein Poli38472_014620 [Pythium oligandrum]